MEINYGLIVMDTRKDEESYEILHFCGCEKKPTLNEANHLREELKNDPEFGLQEIWDVVDILPAPDYIVKQYRDDLKNNIK